MNVRIVNKVDAETLKSVSKWVNNLTDYVIQAKDIEHANENKDLFVFMFNDMIVGIAITNIHTPKVILNDFVIGPTFRMKGYGSKFFEIFQQHLKTEGLKVVRLHPIGPSIEFWRKQGFIHDPSTGINNLKMSYKPLIDCNYSALKNKRGISVWNSKFKKDKSPSLIHLNIDENLVIPCHLDWQVEIRKGDEVLYSAKAKYCDYINFYGGFIFSKN